MEHEGDSDTNCNWCAWYSYQKIGTGTGGLGNKRTSGGRSNYSIIKIGPKYRGESWRLEENSCHSNSSVKPSAKAGVKKSQKSKIIIIISRCRLCGERDQTINPISECSKLVWKEYKTRHDCVDKVIQWELCKKFKFDHTNKWYMHSPVSIQENETCKLLWDFDIQMDHLILARRSDLCCSGWSQSKIERKQKEG